MKKISKTFKLDDIQSFVNEYAKVEKQIPKHIEKFKRDFDQLAILCYHHDVTST